MGWQWHQLHHMQIICISIARISWLSFLQARCSSWCPTNSDKALKADTTCLLTLAVKDHVTGFKTIWLLVKHQSGPSTEFNKGNFPEPICFPGLPWFFTTFCLFYNLSLIPWLLNIFQTNRTQKSDNNKNNNKFPWKLHAANNDDNVNDVVILIKSLHEFT